MLAARVVIPVYWIAKEGQVAHCRWDERFVEDIVAGAQKRPAGFPRVAHRDTIPHDTTDFGVVVFPAGAHDERDLSWLHREIRRLERLILIIAADEGARFPVERIDHAGMQLWVMTPRPSRRYPDGTVFIGDGSAHAWRQPVGSHERTLGWFFAGQVSNSRRVACVEVLRQMGDGLLVETEGFLQGMPREDYLDYLSTARIVPCPSGPDTQDTFRTYEALERGALPIIDLLRPDGRGRAYWQMVAPGAPLLGLAEWGDLPLTMELVNDTWPVPAIRAHAWWHRRRRELAVTFRDQVNGVVGRPQAVHERDLVTVVVPTSPIPSHPSLKIIELTLASVRQRCDAEILVLVDGVREEQMERAEAYDDYVAALLVACEAWPNITPLVFDEHLHQAEMLRRALALIDSKYVLFVEHDTPLVGSFPWDQILETMIDGGLNSLRFYHETRIQEQHWWLMLDSEPVGAHAPYIRTMQWSQRPHLARADFYRALLEEYFHPDARTMLEDVLFGVLDHHWRVDGLEGWDVFRTAVYTPPGDIQRSIHLDGRDGDPKYEMKYRYRGGGIPIGAPNPAVGLP